jgi:hypothetical protein
MQLGISATVGVGRNAVITFSPTGKIHQPSGLRHLQQGRNYGPIRFAMANALRSIWAIYRCTCTVRGQTWVIGDGDFGAFAASPPPRCIWGSARGSPPNGINQYFRPLVGPQRIITSGVAKPPDLSSSRIRSVDYALLRRAIGLLLHRTWILTSYPLNPPVVAGTAT